MKKIILLWILLFIQWAMLALFPWPYSFATAILLGVFLFQKERLFAFGFWVGLFSWFFPLLMTLSRGEGVTSIAVGIFEIPHGLSWILYLIPPLFGAIVTGVGMEIGKYLRMSFSVSKPEERSSS